QSEQVWRQADKYDVPRICFVNKMDKLGADFFFTVKTIRERLNARPLVVQLPIGAESDFQGVVDLVHMKALTWRGDVEKGRKYEVEEIPAELAEQAAEYREQLVEAVAETDEELMEAYFGGEELTTEQIKAGIRKLTVNKEAFPVLCGSAFKNKGVQPLLDAVVDYLPSPLDIPPMQGTLPGGETPAVRRAGVQDRCPPVLRQAHLRPGLLRPREPGCADPQRDPRQEGAHREAVPDALQQGEPGRRGAGRSHLRRRRSEGDHDR